MTEDLEPLVNLDAYPLADDVFRRESKRRLDDAGALVMPGFLRLAAVETVRREGEANKHRAYYTTSKHNIYLTARDPGRPDDHPRNREVASSKGCITTDQISDASPLKRLYRSDAFRAFLCAALGEGELYDYADALSGVNLHFADAGQELGWHFDNSSFAVTLMIEPAERGGVFEYVKDVRDADAGVENDEVARQVLDGEVDPQTLSMEAGALVLFRGRNSMHRVTPVEGSRTRMLAVLAYNSKPGVSLSESARMTFYGRL
jgi:hypothetical protein